MATTTKLTNADLDLLTKEQVRQLRTAGTITADDFADWCDRSETRHNSKTARDVTKPRFITAESANKGKWCGMAGRYDSAFAMLKITATAAEFHRLAKDQIGDGAHSIVAVTTDSKGKELSDDRKFECHYIGKMFAGYNAEQVAYVRQSLGIKS